MKQKLVRLNAVYILALCLLLACSSVQADSAQIICTPLSSNGRTDKIAVRSCKRGRAILVLNNRFGIGAARLQFQRNYRPEVLVLEFRRFNNLESFSIECGARSFSTSLKSAPSTHETTSKKTANPAIEKESDLKIPIIKSGDDSITVQVPCSKILQNSREITIRWIDWYR